MNDQPFLIVGCGSSGSHLIGIILDKHLDIAVGPELGVFNKPEVYKSYNSFKSKFANWLEYGLYVDGYLNYKDFFVGYEQYFWTKSELLLLVDNCDNQREFFDLYFCRVLKARSKKMWGEKTLSNAYCITQFLKLYPKAKILHVVRDGRDVMCSLMRRGFSEYRAASRWLYDVSSCLQYRDEPFYHEVKYEKFVENPKSELLKICSHIGVEYSDVFLDQSPNQYWDGVLQNGKVHNQWKNKPSSNAISTKSINQWKKTLNEKQLSLFWSVRLRKHIITKHGSNISSNLKLMRELGYQLDEIKISSVDNVYYRQAIHAFIERFTGDIVRYGKLRRPLTYIK